MININGVIYSTIESLDAFLFSVNYSENEKQCIRNDFNSVTNPPVSSIAPVTNQQLRSALVMMSFQQNKPYIHPDAIRAFIDTLPEPNKSMAIQSWEYSNEMQRSNPLVNGMAVSMGLTSQDLDAIWAFARTL
jgi:CMP-2-keto-3-deoxyoctulosonic acid synthetase